MAENVEKILVVKIEANQAVQGIANLNRQIETNREAMKGLAADGKKGSVVYAELEQKTKQLTSQKRVLQKEVQNELQLQRQQDGSLAQLRAQLNLLTQQYDKLSRAERENMAVGGKLQKQINQVTTEIKNAEEGTQRYYRNVGNYRNSILEAVGMNSRFGGSLVSIVNAQGGVSGALAAMGSSVKAFGSALWSLMANPVFLGLAGLVGAGMAFKWFYDYNNGIAEATRLTKEFTGLVGDEAIALRNSIQATSDVMGKEFTDTLKTVDSLMAHYHITGQEAMDIINKGFAAGADLNGDMLQKVQQLAPTFHDAGVSADEMMAIITQTRSGIFSDQGLEAIRQASARIREMSSGTRSALQGIGIDVDEMQAKLRDGSMSTFDAIKQVSAAIKDLPDNAEEVGQAMTAVFGRQGKFASQEMIESLAEMSTSLDDVKAKTGEYGELLLENIDKEEELDNVTAALFDMSNRGWEEAKQKAEIFGKEVLIKVVKAIIDLANWYVRLYNRVLPVRAAMQGFIAQFKVLWQVAKLAFNLLVDGFHTVGRAIDAIVNAFHQAGLAVKSFGEGVAIIFSGIANRSVDEIRRGMSILSSGIKSGAASALAGLKGAITGSIDETLGDITGFGKAVGDAFSTAVENTINDRMSEISIPAMLAGGGGGTSGGTSTGGGGSSSGGTSSGGGGGGGSSSGGNTATDKAADELAKRTADLIKKGEALQQKALEEAAKDSEEGINKLAEAQKAAFLRVYGEREQYSGEALAAYDQLLQDIDKKADEAKKKLQDKQAKEREQQQRTAREEAKKLVQAMMDGQADGSAEELKYRLDLLRLQRDAELAEYEKNWQMRTAITDKYAKMEKDIIAEYAQKQREIEIARVASAQQTMGALAGLAEAFGEDNKNAAALAKMLAVGEVMLAQAVAIANAVKAGSNAASPWQMIAQIAASITAVTAAMAQAFKSLDAAKFATGGYVRGAGTGTSDSIPARLSNGESVMTANTTAMFGGLLSSLNQLGGGVPIQVQQTATSVRGEDMLARAVARGVAMLPAPVVSVEDINRGQRQVEVLNQRATL